MSSSCSPLSRPSICSSRKRVSAVLAPHAADGSSQVERRWDLRLRLRPAVRRALCDLVAGPVGDAGVGNTLVVVPSIESVALLLPLQLPFQPQLTLVA